LYLFIIWVSLIVASLFSIYFAYNLIEGIDIISQIYQNSTSRSVVNYQGLDDSVNHIGEIMKFLYSNLLFSICIFYALDLLIVLYINTKIINNKWDLSFIKNIFGESFYKYFMKALSFGSKSNELWIFIGWTILVIATLFSVFAAYFLIKHIDLLTELYLHFKK
jgi:hypothetical protein